VRGARLGILLAVALALSATATGAVEADFDTPHCGKKFRIATHLAPPWIIVNASACINQKCPAAAFGADGGFTYRLMMDRILPQLKAYCVEQGKDPNVVFEWYLPQREVDQSNSVHAVDMVCSNAFDSDGIVPLTDANPVCKSETEYKGPSQYDKCKQAYGDETCLSRGPDMVAGGVKISRSFMDMLHFTTSYLTVSQIIVKRFDGFDPNDFATRVMLVFQPFSAELWVVMAAEVAVVWIMILIVEGPIAQSVAASNANMTIAELENNAKRASSSAVHKEGVSSSTEVVHGAGHLEPGFNVVYDSFYWALGSAFDPGAPGKSPWTAAGRIFMLAHWFMWMILAASFTGTVGPFLSDISNIKILESIDELRSGTFTVAVPGPKWNENDPDTEFQSMYKGGTTKEGVPVSAQLRILENILKNDRNKMFKVYTSTRYETQNEQGANVEPNAILNPCFLPDLNLGLYDMVACASIGDGHPQSLIGDQPAMIWELARRKKAFLGVCQLITVGDAFATEGLGLGFPRNSTFSFAFSRAIERLRARKIIDEMEYDYKIRPKDNTCFLSREDNPNQTTLTMLSGLFLITFGFTLLSVFQSWILYKMFPPKKRDLKKAERDRVLADHRKRSEAEKLALLARFNKRKLAKKGIAGPEHISSFAEAAGEVGKVEKLAQRIAGSARSARDRMKRVIKDVDAREANGEKVRGLESHGPCAGDFVFADFIDSFAEDTTATIGYVSGT